METKEENVNGERLLCPNCMAENLPVRDFCENCGCPIGQFVNVDPLKRIYSQGWLYRKTVSGRITPIVFWGMWLIFGSGLLSMLIVLLLSGLDGALGENSWLWLPALSIVIYIVILYRVTKNYLISRKMTPTRGVNNLTSEVDNK